MPRLTVKIEGLKEIENGWLEMARILGPRRARRIFNPALKRLIRPVYLEILAKTPVRLNGYLLAAVHLRVRSRTRNEIRANSPVADQVATVRTGWEFPGKVGYWNALAVEYGNRVSREQKILRLAFDGHIRSIFMRSRVEFKRILDRRFMKIASMNLRGV